MMLGARRDSPPQLRPEAPPGLLLLFTIDTEGSILRQRNPDPKRVVDELIFGDYGTGVRGGIRLHMDLLEHYGFRGCFFVDVLMEYQFGREVLERTIDAIATRGHEVQLHVHDQHLAWSSDPTLQSLSRGLLGKDKDGFRRLMEVSVDLFERRTGKQPLAYRAGGFRITDVHFGVLEEFGIGIDSSVMVYSNSLVSDWMLTRTQPFRVGGVLELPVTWFLLRDNRAAPETRVFSPNATAGDPVSEMPRSQSGPPRVATYISHSFQFMRANQDASPAAIAALERRVRAKVAPDVADRLLSTLGTNMRIFDGTLDDALVSSAEGILRRIADRPDAQCTTYGEFLSVAERFWRDERHEPVDPVPALDRPRGIATVTGTRVYSSALLSHLATSEASERADDQEGDGAAALLREGGVSWDGREVAVIEPSEPGGVSWLRHAGARVENLPGPEAARRAAFDVVVWSAAFECCPPEKLSERLESAAAMLKPDGLLLLRARTLGVRSGARRGAWPPLAELLFSKDELRSGAASGDLESVEVVAWDAATFAAWFAAQGFELVRERRIPREAVELATIARFSDKLGALKSEELRTSALDVTLRRLPRMRGEPTERWKKTSPRLTPASDPGDSAVRQLAQRFGPITPEDGVLAICPEGRLHTDAVPGLTPTMSRRQALRRLKDHAPSTSPVTALHLDAWLGSAIEPEAYDFIVCAGIEQIEVERLDVAADAIERALRPGGHLLVRIMLAPAPLASVTTILVALLRAGLEVIDRVPDSTFLDCRLVRPLDFADIARFAGQG